MPMFNLNLVKDRRRRTRTMLSLTAAICNSEVTSCGWADFSILGWNSWLQALGSLLMVLIRACIVN